MVIGAKHRGILEADVCVNECKSLRRTVVFEVFVHPRKIDGLFWLLIVCVFS